MDKKKIIAGGLIAIAAGLGLGAGFVLDSPDTIVEEKIVEVIVEVPSEPVVITEIETVIEQVEDTAFLKMMCDRAMFEDIGECKEEVIAEDAALAKALELVNDESELFDFLEDEGMLSDEDEARIVKVYDDFEDIVIVKSNFEDERYVFEIKLRVEDEDEDVKKKLWLKVEVDEDEVELLKVWED